MLIVLAAAIAADAQPVRNPPPAPTRAVTTHDALYDTRIPELDGTHQTLARLRGCVCLMVMPSTSSREEEAVRKVFARLAALEKRYRRRGFSVLVVPGVADAGRELPRTRTIEAWRSRFAAGLHVSGAIRTAGPKAHPLMRLLDASFPKPRKSTGKILAWLVDRRGWAGARLEPDDLGAATDVLDRRIRAVLETTIRPGRFGDAAARALQAALRTARMRNRNVMVSFLMRGQRGSKAFAGFLDSLPMVRVASEHYVPVRLVLPDVVGAEHWLEQCAEGRPVTPPFSVWLSPRGRILDSSFDGRRSIGLPTSRADIGSFVSALRRNAPEWRDAGQVDNVTAALQRARD